MRVLSAGFVTLACTFISVALSSYAKDQFEPVRQTIATLMAERRAPSVAVAVTRYGRIVWEQGFGFADIENRRPATPGTMYSLASLSKPITGAALMTLVQAGKIALDKPVNDYLGDAKVRARLGNANDATVRRVANHSSGLPEHYQFFYRNEPWPVPPPDTTISRYGNLVTAPGEVFRYSNLGYGILSDIIIRVSGEPFADYVRDAVFRKLGMLRSEAANDPSRVAEEAVRYDDHRNPIPLYDTDHPGASAIYASAHDLALFGMFALKDHLPETQTILSPSRIDEMLRPSFDEGNGTGYGVGWETSMVGGLRMFAHTGGMPGVAAEMRLIPSSDLVIVVLTNDGDNQLTHLITDQITAIEIPGWKKPPPQPPKPEPGPPVALAGTWKGVVATYRGDVPLTLAISPDGEVRAKLGDQLETLLNRARLGPDGVLRGLMPGNLGLEEEVRRQHVLALNLTLRSGNILNGAITTRADRDGASPAQDLFASVNGQPAPASVQNQAFILAQWAELKKQ